MTRHIHLTPLGGIAGDMFAAAMLDALPDLRAPVLQAVAAVLPDGHPAVSVVETVKAGLTAARFDVPAFESRAPVHYPDMAALLEQSTLSDPVKQAAGAMLRLLAEAEAGVHGCKVEQVHFHEIADWDTLADLTAAAAILDALSGASWSLDPLPLGGGTVKTQHGLMPVPAPATAELLKGLPVHDDGLLGERVTPTGACIVRYIHDRIGLSPRPAGSLGATGRGAGTRDLPDRPNILVAQLIETGAPSQDRVTVIECDIDDMTAEELAAACDTLRAEKGVRDLTSHPVFGKKGRLATRLCLLVDVGHANAVANSVFNQTSTIGLRLREDRRFVLPRDLSDVGDVRVKSVLRPGGTLTAKAESDDLAGADSLADRRRMARKAEGSE